MQILYVNKPNSIELDPWIEMLRFDWVRVRLQISTSIFPAKGSGLKRDQKRFAVSICPAAGQVVENTPCPAVKLFVNFQFIMLNPCLYG